MANAPEAVRTYVTPRGIIRQAALDPAWPFPGGGFLAAELTTVSNGHRSHRTITKSDGPLPEDWFTAFTAPRLIFGDIRLDRPAVMGILNVTPDSFSDGGRAATAEAAIVLGRSMAEAGAAIIDVGGESTRPGAEPVSEQEEQRRVLPVVQALADDGIKVSIDTRNASTMAAAIAAGATIINDISALRGPGALDAVSKSTASVILMHMQGDPRTMQVAPRYDWAPGDIFDFLKGRIAACSAAGIPLHRIAADPGIGFGQNDDHIADVFDHLAMFHGLGCALVLGASRKGFIGRWSRGAGPHDRLSGSIAAAIHAVGQGVQIVRVHDVAETRQALAINFGSRM